MSALQKILGRIRRKPVLLLPAFVSALLSAVSFGLFLSLHGTDTVLDYAAPSFSLITDSLGPMTAVLAVALFAFFAAVYCTVRFHVTSVVLSLIMGLDMLVSMSMEHSCLEEIFLPAGWAGNLLVLAGFMLMLSAAAEALWFLFDSEVRCRPSRTLWEKDASEKRLSLGKGFLGVMLLWSPGLFMCYPGSVYNDTKNQIKSWLGLRYRTASDPVLTTLFYGALYELGVAGQAIFNTSTLAQEKGIFLPVLMQAMVMAFAVSLTAVKARELTRSRAWQAGIILYFGLTAIWQSGAELMLKDVLHSGFFLMFCCCYLECLKKEGLSKTDLLVLFLTLNLTAYTRKAAFYIGILCVITLMVMKRHQKVFLRLAAVLAAFVSLFQFSSHVLYPMLGIEPEWKSENYSLQFQQVALYCKTYREEMTEEEIAIIDSTLDFDVIIEKYTPMISDGVKSTFHDTDLDHADFWDLYRKMIFRHPLFFVKATIMNSFEHRNPWLEHVNFFTGIERNDGFITVDYTYPRLSSAIRSYWHAWPKIPVLRLLCTNGFYSWLLLLALGYAIIRRSPLGFAGLVPALTIVVGLFMSHVNGELRYGYPMIAVTPLLLAWVIYAAACRAGEKAEAPSVGKKGAGHPRQTHTARKHRNYTALARDIAATVRRSAKDIRNLIRQSGQDET